MAESVRPPTLSATHPHPISYQCNTDYECQNGATATHRPRKSVAFEEGATIVDGNGDVKQTNGAPRKNSAESHSGKHTIEFVSCHRETDFGP